MRLVYKSTICLLLLLAACSGPDYMPQYFPSDDNGDKTPVASKPETEESSAVGSGNCTVQFTSTLCVYIKGETLEVGTGDEEPLCSDIDPILIEVSNGSNLIIRGSTFPDIPFEGHGLPAPITINGKGSTDGSDNIGNGKLDPSGNITIEGFSFFVNALGMVGEIPELTLTSGKVEDLPDLPDIEGSPLASNGDLKLVAGTVLGHLFPAADEKLLGASIQAVFEGAVAPLPSECAGKGSSPQSTFVTKLVDDAEGNETEALLPGGNRMEVGSGTFIAESPQDIGPKFESFARFKIVNATSKPLPLNIPPLIGPFLIEALQSGGLNQSLQPKKPLVIKITFKPTIENVKEAGKVEEMLMIGSDIYQIAGEALKPSGKVSIDVVDSSGATITAQADKLAIGEVTLSSTPRREFFLCKQIVCDGKEKPTQCVPCVDVLTNVCQLLLVDKNGDPIEAVDAGCKLPNAANSLAVGFSDFSAPIKQIINIKNTGPKPISIQSVELKEVPGSKSVSQFKLSGLANKVFPITLAPYESSHESLSIVVVYEPDDFIGFDGTEAVVGHPAKDKAILNIATDSGGAFLELLGITAIKEVPALEVYFKSAIGTKLITNGSTFSFRGITTDTTDLAVPVFIKLSDSANAPIRIVKIETDLPANFEWLDTKEKINAKPENVRCTITDLNPVNLIPNGYTIAPDGFTTDTMPLFGCVNFHMTGAKQHSYEALFIITTQEIDKNGEPAKNPDGSIKQTSFKIKLLSVVNPMKGRLVWRMTQTMAIIMNPQFPGNSAVASKEEIDYQIADGLAKEEDRFVMPSAIIFDPFDEETITDEQGNTISMPSDGVTAVYRKLDTHPVTKQYDDPFLADWTSLEYDATAPIGSRGAFFDYPNLPEDYMDTGLRIFTASLSYPGPLATPEQRPENVSLCQQVDPCSEEGQKMHGKGPTEKDKRGVCAFFYTSAGAWQSPSFGEEHADLCKNVDQPQKLNDIKGYYDLNGTMNFPDIGMRLWGPTYFHNPSGPLGPVPPLDALFHVTFTTDVLLPKDASAENAIDLLPDKRVNTGKLEHKINLNDTTIDLPRLCETSVKNRLIHGEYYSTWKYLKPYLVKDEEGTTPAGCPEPGEPYTGGSAYLRGKPMDQETGMASFVAAAKFASDDNLTFAFKDVMFFIALNGWFCDPTGPEDQWEGQHCYDLKFNERDAKSMVSIME